MSEAKTQAKKTSVAAFLKLRYASGREAEWPVIGFSPRKNDLTLYLGLGSGKYEALMARRGRHKAGKGCLYLERLEDVDRSVLKQLIEASVQAKASKRVDRQV